MTHKQSSNFTSVCKFAFQLQFKSVFLEISPYKCQHRSAEDGGNGPQSPLPGSGENHAGGPVGKGIGDPPRRILGRIEGLMVGRTTGVM